MGKKVKLKLPHFHESDTWYMCFVLTHAPVATAARAAATGLVSIRICLLQYLSNPGNMFARPCRLYGYYPATLS